MNTKPQSESSIQAQIVKWYHNNFCLSNHRPQCLIFSVPNGGYRNKMEAMALNATGLLKGTSDLIVIHMPKKPNGEIFDIIGFAINNPIIAFVEVKSKKGTQTPD